MDSGAQNPIIFSHSAVIAILPQWSARELQCFKHEVAYYQNIALQTKQYFLRWTNTGNVFQMHKLWNAVLTLNTFKADSVYKP